MNGSTTTKFYFQLQYRRFIRLLNDNGIYPWLIFPVAVIFFVFLSFKLLINFAFGELIYLLLAVSIAFPLMDRDRLQFLKQICTNRNYFQIRMIEQLVVLFPFIVGLLIFEWWWYAAALMVLAMYFSFGKVNYQFPYSIPTPFGKYPFEFPSGFRKSLPLIMVAYALVPIGLNVDNFNLALASIAVVGFVVGGFHSAPEPKFYIWIFKYSPTTFLKKKIITIFRNTFLLTLPIIGTLLYYSLESYIMVLLLLVAAIAFAVMCMLSKYLAYPQEINLTQGLAMGASILFPPIMLVIIPWFYFKALKSLQPILQ